MSFFYYISGIAEQKIQDAMRDGEFDDLEGKGRPLKLEDDSNVPQELRMAYKILKNSGHLPPELEEEREIRRDIDLLSQCSDEKELYRRMKKVNYMISKLNMKRNKPINFEFQGVYYEKAVQAVGLSDDMENSLEKPMGEAMEKPMEETMEKPMKEPKGEPKE
jgi:hypothetical protein